MPSYPVNGKGCAQDLTVARMDCEDESAFGMNHTATPSETKLFCGEQTVLTLVLVNNPIDFNMKVWMSKSHSHGKTKKSRRPWNIGRVR